MKNELDKCVEAYGNDNLYYFDEKIILNWYSKRVLETSNQNWRVLDLGLGHGITANVFSEYFNDYTILDGSSEIINKYKSEFPNSTAQIVKTYFENYENDKKYDLIIMGFILEHVDNPIEIMKKYGKFLKPDGKIIVTVPNAEAMNRRLGKYAGLLDDLTELSDYDKILGHKRYFTLDSFKNCAQICNLKIIKIEGIYLKPFTTKQIISLDFNENILDALCELGVEYPELSLGLFFELKI